MNLEEVEPGEGWHSSPGYLGLEEETTACGAGEHHWLREAL